MPRPADPVVVRNPARGTWWMFYTNRRANAAGLPGVSRVHGTNIGIAESRDGGASWRYVGSADIELPAALGGSQATHWAPDIVRADDGSWHMFLTVVPGVFTDRNHPRRIVRLTSTDLRTWREARDIPLASGRVIDAATWTRQPGNLLRQPGRGLDDGAIGGHCDVVVSGDRAWLFYFTHPGRGGVEGGAGSGTDGPEQRRSTIQLTELILSGDSLRVERDAPTRIALGGG